MAKLKQSIKIKYAIAKNNDARYKKVATKYTYTKRTPTTTTKKYSYTKKILVNGKYRYYYA